MRIQLQNFIPRHSCLTSAAGTCQDTWQHHSFGTQWVFRSFFGFFADPYYSLIVISKPISGGNSLLWNSSLKINHWPCKWSICTLSFEINCPLIYQDLCSWPWGLVKFSFSEVLDSRKVTVTQLLILTYYLNGGNNQNDFSIIYTDYVIPSLTSSIIKAPFHGYSGKLAFLEHTTPE